MLASGAYNQEVAEVWALRESVVRLNARFLMFNTLMFMFSGPPKYRRRCGAE